MADLKFTREEISVIERNLGFIVFDWAKHLIQHIISQARDAGVDIVCMNTPESLSAGSITEGKTDYFYEKLPSIMGFKKEKTNLRGNQEVLWVYHLDSVSASAIDRFLKIAGKQYRLQDIPNKYQGAFIGIIGKKEFYDESDVKRVLEIVTKNQSKGNTSSKYYYDWSKKWTGGQRFDDNISENVVLQKVTTPIQEKILNHPAMLKFWSYLLSHTQHFDQDTIGFALVSKVRQKVWVINEIQTDVINKYMELRRIDKLDADRGENKKNEISWETLRDMLVAQNRSNWIERLEVNDGLKNEILANPNMIGELPDDTQDIDKWIRDRSGNGNLIRHFQSVNFNQRIFRL